MTGEKTLPKAGLPTWAQSRRAANMLEKIAARLSAGRYNDEARDEFEAEQFEHDVFEAVAILIPEYKP